jgi:hypothetical protein
MPAFAQAGPRQSAPPTMTLRHLGRRYWIRSIRQVDPGDDFFAHVNGKWVRRRTRSRPTCHASACSTSARRSDLPMSSGWWHGWLLRTRRQARRSGGSSMPTTLPRPGRDRCRGPHPAQPYLTDLSRAGSGQPGPLFAARASRLVSAGVTIDAKDPDSPCGVGRLRRHGPARSRLLPRRHRTEPRPPRKIHGISRLHARPGGLCRSPAVGADGLRFRAPGGRARMGAADDAHPRSHLQRADPRRAARAVRHFPIDAMLEDRRFRP